MQLSMPGFDGFFPGTEPIIDRGINQPSPQQLIALHQLF